MLHFILQTSLITKNYSTFARYLTVHLSYDILKIYEKEGYKVQMTFQLFQYTIPPGDSLFFLAQRFNTTVDAIMSVNPGLNPYNLLIGQVILIPMR